MLLFQQFQRLNSHEISLFSSREWTCQTTPVAGTMKGQLLLHTPLVSFWLPLGLPLVGDQHHSHRIMQERNSIVRSVVTRPLVNQSS